MKLFYGFLNLVFHGLHICIIFFTLFGWICKETRPANLILIIFTLASWYILGPWLGKEGYCPITDWHWKIRMRMGVEQLPDSYIKFWLGWLSGEDINSERVNLLTLVAILLSGSISLILNVLDWI